MLDSAIEVLLHEYTEGITRGFDETIGMAAIFVGGVWRRGTEKGTREQRQQREQREQRDE